MCRGPSDTSNTVLCFVEPSYCFKNSDFDAIIEVPYMHFHSKGILPKTKIWPILKVAFPF